MFWFYHDKKIKMDRDIRPEIRLIVTEKCNYECVYCCKEGGGYGEATLEQVIELGQLVNSLGLPHIHITGGEPTLRGDLEQIISSLKLIGIENIALTTNGSRLNDKYLDRLVQAGLDELHVHFQSFNREDYGRTTGQVIEPRNIADMTVKASKRIPTRFNVPVTSINYNGVNDTLNFAYGNGIGVALLELTGSKKLKIRKREIKDLLFNWAESNEYILEQESDMNEFGELYQINGTNTTVRILPSNPNCDLTLQNPEHECKIKDNRVWIGAANGRYLYTDCMYKHPTEISLRELRERLTVKYVSSQ